MGRPAFSFVRDFEPAPAATFRVDQHYLLCASRGVLRLEAAGTVWTLPPARAALIAAGSPIEVTIVTAMTSASVLVRPEFAAPPPAELTVFDMTPLAHALVAECGQWGEADEPLPERATIMFRALVAATWTLAANPSPARMPAGRSPEVRRALALTDRELAGEPRFATIAAEVGLAPRSLARRFEAELAMTWRAALRRMRVLRAIEHLAASDESIALVAARVGYSSLSAFQAAFRDLMGQTPAAYRAGCGAPPPGP